AMACVTRLAGYDAGLVVSASHNPYHDNGIKVFARTGEKLSDALEERVEALVLDTRAGPPDSGTASTDSARPPSGDRSLGPDELAGRYLAWLLEAAGPAFTLKGSTLALDCPN